MTQHAIKTKQCLKCSTPLIDQEHTDEDFKNYCDRCYIQEIADNDECDDVDII